MKRILTIAIAMSVGLISANISREITSDINLNKSTAELFNAVETGSMKKVKKILKKESVEINTLNNQGKTVLDLAVEKKATKIAGLLINHGAKVTSEEYAYELKSMFKSRSNKFFLGGFLLNPWLWIGTYNGLSNAAAVEIL